MRYGRKVKGFLVIISYLRADEEDYEKLLDKVSGIGVRCTVEDHLGNLFRLPEGVYYIPELIGSPDAICERVRSYIQELCGSEVFVCDMQGWWGNLPPCN